MEAAAICLCIGSLYGWRWLAHAAELAGLGYATASWLNVASSMFVFGLLIYLLARGRGWISRLLGLRPFVLLGEISFSMYLLHQMLLYFQSGHAAIFAQMPNTVAFSLFMTVLLLSSFVSWNFIEMPARRLIVGDSRIHGSSVVKQRTHGHMTWGRGPISAGLALAALLFGLRWWSMIPPPAVGMTAVNPAVTTTYPSAGLSCNLESLDAKPFPATAALMVKAGRFKLAGWLLPEHSRQTRSSATLLLTSEANGARWQAPLAIASQRPDVLSNNHAVDTGNAGFNELLDLTGIPSGRYRLSLDFDDLGQSYTCDNGRVIQID